MLEVGRIVKAHGLKGEVVVDLTTNMIEARTASGAEFWADDRRFVVTAARPHHGKWLFTFEGVTDRNEAERLRSTVLTAEPLDSEDEVFVHELIGVRLVDQNEVDHGEVVAVIDNPASDLMELDDGRLVPLSFYVDHNAETVRVDVPPGLLDGDPVG